MEENVISHNTPRTTADYKTAIEQCLLKMQRLREQMDSDQADIDRLKAETRALLAQMKAA